MAISLLDINPGDTIQGMVEKINYNFDQLQANGGGPQGIRGEQGDQGVRGPRGFQGDQGVRGNMWFIKTNGTSPIPDETPTDNDLSFDGNAEVYIFSEGAWEDTHFNIASALESPFAAFDNDSIGVRNVYEDRHLVLGAIEDLDNINTKPSLVICTNMASDADSHTDGIEFYHREDNTEGLEPSNRFGGLGIKTDSFSNMELTLESVGTLKITANTDTNDETSLVLEGSNKTLKWTGFNGVTTDSNVFPLLLTNSEGKMMTGALDGNNNYTYDWCVFKRNASSTRETFLMPKLSNLGNTSYLGYTNNRILGLFLGTSDQISPGFIFGTKNNLLGYGLLIGSSSTDTDAAAVLGVHNAGITVGTPLVATNDLSGVNGKRRGITIKDDESAGGCLTLAGNGAATDYIANAMSARAFVYYMSTKSSECVGKLDMSASYVDDLPKGSQYGSNSIITINTKSSANGNAVNKLANQLTIKGGKGGNSISITGGRAYNKKRGGDVYISGGDVIYEDPESATNPNEIYYQPHYFGDVVIGVNPDNHKKYYENYTGTDSNGDRGVNDPKNLQKLDFYDINNFTAHANNIWLDSDAQSRVFRSNYYKSGTTNGYGLGSYPSITNVDHLTLDMSGLCTAHHGSPIILTEDNEYRHQMMSGQMTYIVRKRWVNNAIDTKVFPFIYPNTENTWRGDVYALVATDWIKVGNMVQCHTKMNFYVVVGEALYVLYNGYNYSSLNNGNNVIHKRNTNGLIPNILLPVVLKLDGEVLYGSSVVGSGTVYAERKLTSGTNMETNTPGFLIGAKNVIFSGKARNAIGNVFNNGHHNNNGELTAASAYPMGLNLNTDNNNPLRMWARDIPTANYETAFSDNDLLFNSVPYIVPNCLVSDTSGNVTYDKMAEFREFFTTGEFNYTYMLNPYFDIAEHAPFRQNWADLLDFRILDVLVPNATLWNRSLNLNLGNG